MLPVRTSLWSVSNTVYTYIYCLRHACYRHHYSIRHDSATLITALRCKIEIACFHLLTFSILLLYLSFSLATLFLQRSLSAIVIHTADRRYKVALWGQFLYPTCRLTLHVNIACAVAETVSPQVRARFQSCGICGGESGTGTGLLRLLRFPCHSFIPPISPQSLPSIIQGCYNSQINGYSKSPLGSTPENKVTFNLKYFLQMTLY
jgi:hypothetical protein